MASPCGAQTRGMKPAWMMRHHQGCSESVANVPATRPIARLVSSQGRAAAFQPKYGQASERTRMTAAPYRANCRMGGADMPPLCHQGLSQRGPFIPGLVGSGLANRAVASHGGGPGGQRVCVRIGAGGMQQQIEVGFVLGEQLTVDGFFGRKTEGVEPAAKQAAQNRQSAENRP